MLSKAFLLSVSFLIMTTIINASEYDTNLSSETHTHHTGAQRSVREILGENNPIEHMRGQLRFGYITQRYDTSPTLDAYGIGGHIHFDTQSYRGFRLGISAYGVFDATFDSDDAFTHPDFFDDEKESFAVLSELYLDYRTESDDLRIRLGRQMFDSPHADSDDIRMMPNYFEAYRIRYAPTSKTTLQAGWIRKMAGWENGTDASRFVDLSDVLGADADTDGLFFISAEFTPDDDLDIAVWVYRFDDIADIVYAEAGYHLFLAQDTELMLGMQWDYTHETGKALLGIQSANTYGLNAEIAFEKLGVHLLGAYNRDNGKTGASALNLGGGALFTSMEDLTLDALGEKGDAFTVGAGYYFENIGIKNISVSIAYARFASDSDRFKAHETDISVIYDITDALSCELVYADVDFDRPAAQEGYRIVRFRADYNF